MGVKGLQSFMEYSCPNGAYEVNIREIVESYRRKTDREVVIVVDGLSCLRPLYGQLDWICGGQVREYFEVFQKFVQAFQDIGVKLVVFFDGPVPSWKNKVWVERRLQNLQGVYQIFDHIGEGKHPSKFDGDTFILPNGLVDAASHAITTFKNCEVHRSVKECDEEIAEYVREHKCFAILGQDSDFVIYHGPQYYLSAIHFNIEKMTTKNYDRWSLARHLNLSPGLLPLLACLVGNDSIHHNDLLPFHKNICNSNTLFGRPPLKEIICKVASFIRHNTDEKHLYQSLPMISRRVFGDVSKASVLNFCVRSYSVNTYSVTQVPHTKIGWENVKKYAEMCFRNGDLDCTIYAVMHKLPYMCGTGLEDFRQPELPPATAVYLPMRQRVYGITLHEMPKDSESHAVEEWCMQGERSLDKPTFVPVISPKPGSHPGLMALWDENDKSTEMLSKKWALVAHAVSTELDPDILRSVPPKLLAPTLLLYFLNHEVPSRFLKTWEVDAFIATAVVLPTLTTADLAKIQIEKAEPRAVQLACIYGRGSSIIKMLMDVCGRPIPAIEVSAWHYFDGKLFQTMYQKAQSGKTAIDLCNHQVAQLEQFNHIRSIVLPAQE